MPHWLNQKINWLEKILATDVRYLIRGSFWLSGGQGLSSLIAILMAVAFANLIPPTVYGEYKYLLSCSGLLAILTLPSLNTALIRAVTNNQLGTFWAALKYRLMGGLVLISAGLATSAYYYWMDNINLAIGFLLIAIFTPLMESAITYAAVLNGKKLFGVLTSYNLTTQGLSSAVVFVVINLTHQVWIILLSYLVSYTILNWFFLNLTTRRHITNNQTDQSALNFGLRLSAVNFLASASSYFDSILLWHLLGPVQVATYTFAQAAVTPAKTLLKSVLNLALPKFATKQTHEIRQTLLGKVWKSILLITPAVIIFILIIPLVFKLLFPIYESSIPYAQVLAITLIFFPEKLMGIVFTAQMKEKQLYSLNIINPLIKIGLLAILIPLYGLWGAVIAIVAQQIVASLLSLWFFWRLPTKARA